MKIQPFGDSAIVVQFGEDANMSVYQKIHSLCRKLEVEPLPGMIECVPSFTSVTIYYDCFRAVMSHACKTDETPYEMIFRKLDRILKSHAGYLGETFEVTEVVVPVCYGGEFGPDLEVVAAYHQLTSEEVIRINSEGTYFAYMIGFSPGFPYLGGLSKKLATPRRKHPRLAIPAGSVGIAGNQTGIYSMETPGGWQIIGRTPLRLFNPDQSPPTLIQAGNYVKFQPVSKEEYDDYLGRDGQ
ncbi:5-oxoprolinase subunit PxpB [Aeribacillus pallidus]|nr:5-oxoprolinase subunit PxpB [Aeribacillus pallidus]